MKVLKFFGWVFVGSVAVVVVWLASYVIYGNFLQGKPEVRVSAFNSTPYAAGEAQRGILPITKLLRTYRYRYEYNNSGLSYPKVDHDQYLQDHPNDAVLESFSQGVGLEVTVYSNELPDPEYFDFDGTVLAGEWPGTKGRRP